VRGARGRKERRSGRAGMLEGQGKGVNEREQWPRRGARVGTEGM